MASLQTVLAPLKHFALVFSAESKRLIAYRVQFWCELILSSAIELLVTLTVWRAVFEANNFDRVSGYSFEEMLVYATAAVFFAQAMRGTNIGTFARDIYDGSLTKYLIYPLSIYSYKFGTFFPRAPFALIQMAIALLGIYLLDLWPPSLRLHPTLLAASLAAVFLAAVAYFLLLFCVEAFAFWADNVWTLSLMLQAAVLLLSGKLVPLDLFPEKLQAALGYLPFGYLVFFPAKIFLGEVHGLQLVTGFVVLLLWIAALFSLSLAIYRRGLHRYTGVGM